MAGPARPARNRDKKLRGEPELQKLELLKLIAPVACCCVPVSRQCVLFRVWPTLTARDCHRRTAMRFKTHFKRNLSLFERIVESSTVISRAIYPLLSSSVVIWSYCCVNLLRVVLEPSRRARRRRQLRFLKR